MTERSKRYIPVGTGRNRLQGVVPIEDVGYPPDKPVYEMSVHVADIDGDIDGVPFTGVVTRDLSFNITVEFSQGSQLDHQEGRFRLNLRDFIEAAQTEWGNRKRAKAKKVKS